jgi:mono/diheme cytochrome c family protein
MKCRTWVGAAALLGSAASAADDASAAQGRRLFLGEAPLPARIVGQDFALPVQASRCVNCHGPGAAAAPPAASAPAAAPVLSASTLTDALRRRGGPPSRYDAATLCTLLRSGIDPAYVMILRTMPRYEVSDADCRSLWLHLMERR